MDLEIRTVEQHEWDPLLRMMSLTFGETIDPDEAAAARKVTEFDRTIAAYDDGAMVGSGSIASLEISVPGGTAPVAASSPAAASMSTASPAPRPSWSAAEASSSTTATRP